CAGRRRAPSHAFFGYARRMQGSPYRPPPGPPQNDELAQLARQGQMRLQAAAMEREQGERVGENRNLRVAIGAVRGSPIKRALLAVILVGLLSLAGGIVG